MLLSLKRDRFWNAWWRLLLVGLAVMLLVVAPLVSCREPTYPVTAYPVTATIEEAGKMLGVILPVPTYLPPDCDVREVKVDPTESAVKYYIHDDEKKYDLRLDIWYYKDILMPYKYTGSPPKTSFNDPQNPLLIGGGLWESDETWLLIWSLRSADKKGGFNLRLYANSKNLTHGEAIKIALSVRQPEVAIGGCSPWRGSPS